MGSMRERLRQAVEDQRKLIHRKAETKKDLETEKAFRPVREAAEQLGRELGQVPELLVTIDPYGVWIDVPDKHIWFSYDPVHRRFIGSELDSLWMEGGLREEHFGWDSADACIDAMVQACARGVLLAEAASRIRSAH